ncbi:MAG TPA: GDP-mannose 4,6-dehydratase, partial [bacterium]|nr:GDP-mannose 4,6-dehydratase [bacterium]
MSAPRGRSILVTGGAGFIGSNFTRYLLGRGGAARVTVLDKFTYAGHPATLRDLARDPRFHLVKGDIADAPLVRRVMRAAKPDWVVNFAAESHV